MKPCKRPTSLLAIFDKVNSKYLGGLCCAGIQWKRLSTKDGNVTLGLSLIHI